MGKKGKSQMWMDLKNDFLKGHIDFPGHTSIESAEVTDARRLASFAGVPLLPGLFEFDSYGPLGELDLNADSGLTDEDIVAMALNKDYNLVNAMSMLHNDVEIDTTKSSSNTEAPAGENQHEQKSAQDAHAFSESVYSFDPHQKDLFPSNKSKLSPEVREGWWRAILTEWTSLLEYGAFKVVPIEESKGQKMFSALWVLKRKFSGTTSAISRLKARLVVRGFEQRPGAHFDESNLYAGVMMYSSLRTLLSMATAKGFGISLRDVRNAYIQSDLPDELYMELPEGFKEEGKCLRLTKALYGLRQAGHLWSNTFSGFLRSLSFERNLADPSIHSLIWKDDKTG